MVTLNQLIKDINPNLETPPDWEQLGSLFNLPISYNSDKRLKAYFIQRWFCTDSYVGLRAYFLDKEFVATSWQRGRKLDEEFTFVSKEKCKELYSYISSLIREEEEEDGEFKFYEPNSLDKETYKDTFKVEYNCQITQKTGLLDGIPVLINKCNYSFKDLNKYFYTVEITLPDGTITEVDCNQLDFEYNK